MTVLNRRAFTGSLAGAVAWAQFFVLLTQTRALASTVAPLMKRWLDGQIALAKYLRTDVLSPIQWQGAIEALNQSIPLDELLSHVEFDTFASRLEALGPGEHRQGLSLTDFVGSRIGTALFYVPKGDAIPPHGHNALVTAHLILKGRFRARTFDRVRDEPGRIFLRPRLDMIVGPSSTVSMSDDRDNVHWFVADGSPVFTFDVVIGRIGQRRYLNPPNHEGRIYVDPALKPGQDDLIAATVIDGVAAHERYGRA